MAPIILALVVLVGCGAAAAPEPEAEATEPTEAAPTLQVAESENIEAQDAAATAVEENSEDNTLVVWVPEVINPGADTPGSEALLTMLAQFDETNPDIEVIVEVKRVSGDGSMLSYLQSAPPVAPSVVPDLVLLDRNGLVTAQTNDLIVPIEDLIDPEVTTHLYPIAVEMGTVDGTVAGVNYLLNTDHLIYRATFFPSRVPNTYDAVLAGLTPFAFPAGPLSDINRTTLTQYLAEGGRLVDENGEPVLDAEPLSDVLAFYADAKRLNVIDTNLFQIADAAQTLQLYRDRQVNMAEVSARDYLLIRETIPNTRPTWTPTATGDPTGLLTGWSWAVTTRDSLRQERAITFINFVLNPIVHGTYTLNAGWVPSQTTALEVWGNDDPYVAFADVLLQNALILPSQSVRNTPGEAMQQAVEEVLLDNARPIQAASQAANAVNSVEGEVQ